MKPGITLLIVGKNAKERKKKLDQILTQAFPKPAKFNPNLIHLTGNIGIDEVRNFKLALHQKPYMGQIQVGLAEIENITTEAQNALLKLIEEPSESCQIVITADNLGKLQPTIISRCRIIFTSDKIEPTFTTKTQKEAIILYQGDIADKFFLANNVQLNDPAVWCENQIIFWHQVFLSQLGVISLQDHQVKKIAKGATLPKTTKILKGLLKTQNLLKLNINPRLLLENLFLSCEARQGR